MADNGNTDEAVINVDEEVAAGITAEANDEVVVVEVDPEIHCNRMILDALGFGSLQPTREKVRLKAEGVEVLDLDDRDIKVLSNSINEFKELKVLSLRNNQLSELPDDLNLPSLKLINFYNNRFTSFPSVLKQHINLQCIIFAGNQIFELPSDTFKSFKNLQVLDLNCNPISKVPDLSHCMELELLGIGECGLSSIPDWIGTLKNLKDLVLFRNPDLTELPNSIRCVKQAIINVHNRMREHHFTDNIVIFDECDRVEAMVQAASDCVWNERRKILCIKPIPKVAMVNGSEYTMTDKSKMQRGAVYEVFFGGNVERQNLIRKKIAQYLI